MLISALASALALALAASPPTDRPLVVIVLPQSRGADHAYSVEASIRLRGELRGAGVAVRTIEGSGTAEAPDDLPRIAREQHALAAIALMWGPGVEATDIWIVDRRTGKFVHKHVDTSKEGDQSAEVLAIRTAELIRADLVDVFLPPPAPPAQTLPQPPQPPQTPPLPQTSPPQTSPQPAPQSAPHPSPTPTPLPPTPRGITAVPQHAATRRVHLRFAAGPTGLFVRGAPPALAATLDVGLLVDRSWLVRASASGLATNESIHLDTNTNWSDLSQSTATVQVQYRRALGWRLSAGADLGAGLLHVAAQGHASAPLQGVSVSQTSFCGTAGLALNLGLGSSFELSMEGQALLAARPVDVWAANSGPARIGQPTVLVTVFLAVMP
jgi:hypothetical protein